MLLDEGVSAASLADKLRGFSKSVRGGRMRLLSCVWVAVAAALLSVAPAAGQSGPAPHSNRYVVRYDHWTDADERA